MKIDLILTSFKSTKIQILVAFAIAIYKLWSEKTWFLWRIHTRGMLRRVFLQGDLFKYWAIIVVYKICLLWHLYRVIVYCWTKVWCPSVQPWILLRQLWMNANVGRPISHAIEGIQCATLQAIRTAYLQSTTDLTTPHVEAVHGRVEIWIICETLR